MDRLFLLDDELLNKSVEFLKIQTDVQIKVIDMDTNQMISIWLEPYQIKELVEFLNIEL